MDNSDNVVNLRMAGDNLALAIQVYIYSTPKQKHDRQLGAAINTALAAWENAKQQTKGAQ